MANPENFSPDPSATPSPANSENVFPENLENPAPTSPENPFLAIRTRSFIVWIPISILGLACLLLILSIPWAMFVLFGNPDAGAVNLAHPDPLFFLVISNLWLYGILAFWCFLQIQRSHLKFAQLLGKLPSHHRRLSLLLLVIPLLMFSLGSGQLFLSGVARFFPKFATSLWKDQLLLSNTETSVPLVYNGFLIILLVVVAPLVEELLFRGLILQRLATKWGFTAGIATSSLLFGILHINVIGLSVFGIVMSVLYFQTRTLWLPVGVHALNNGAAVLLSFLSKLFNPSPQNLNLEQLISTWRLGVLFVALSFPLLILYLYRNWPRNNQLLPYWANGTGNSYQSSVGVG